MNDDLCDPAKLDLNAGLRGGCLHADPVAHAERVDERDAPEIEDEAACFGAAEQVHEAGGLVQRAREHQLALTGLDLQTAHA